MLMYDTEEDNGNKYIPKLSIEELEKAEEVQKLSLLEHMNLILKIHFSLQESCDDKEKYKQALDAHLTICSSILGINTFQVLILSYILNNSSIRLKSLEKFLQVTRIECLKYLDDFDILVNKHLIKKSSNELDSEYWVPYAVIKLLREGTTITITPHYFSSNKEFFLYQKNIFHECQHEEISSKLLIKDFSDLLNNNKELEFIQNLCKFPLSIENKLIVSFLCAFYYLDETETFNFYSISNVNKCLFGIKNDLEQLFEYNLIEYAGDDFKDKENIVLTDKAKTELLGIKEFLTKKKTDSSFLCYEDIVQKELFYNSKEKIQVKQLTDLLLEEKYIEVTKRLKEKGMKTGFACMFFGLPGTGKSETALQIARLSGRDILPIDISTTKSYWFGESEKIIKLIFLKYREKVKEAIKKQMPVPILVLNEADAIINKRKDTFLSGVAQTENNIQNIILQELESLDGILIATTNMIENIDPAFDRRFIYKIEFKKPEAEIRQTIWNSIVPELTKEEAKKLAGEFDFSGGQIENIAHKHTISSIINGKDPKIADLIRFCNEESMFKESPKIGF